MSTIKILDKQGVPHDIDTGLWEQLKKQKPCNYTPAEFTPPDDVIEFQKKNEVDAFIAEKTCCKDGENCCKNECEKEAIPEVIKTGIDVGYNANIEWDKRDIAEIERRKERGGFQPPKEELYTFNPDFNGIYTDENNKEIVPGVIESETQTEFEALPEVTEENKHLPKESKPKVGRKPKNGK